MAEPSGSTSGDSEGNRLLERARASLGKGERLPPPKTWREYLVGVVVWVATNWHTEPGKVGDYCCPACESDKWELGQVVGLETNTRWPSPTDGSYPSFPYVQIECTKCGHMQMLDALKIFEPQDPA
jgi:hypothetical protein